MRPILQRWVWHSDPAKGGYHFWCPGCEELHTLDDTWKFNGDTETPTFSPSVLVTWGSNQPNRRCHLYIRTGRLQFLGDCTHKLAGQTVPMVELPDWVLD